MTASWEKKGDVYIYDSNKTGKSVSEDGEW